jgi:hypothetical protein
MNEYREIITKSGATIKVLVTETIEPPETLEQKLARLEQDNLILMDVLATLYDELQTIKGGTE